MDILVVMISCHAKPLLLKLGSSDPGLRFADEQHQCSRNATFHFERSRASSLAGTAHRIEI